MAGGRSGLFPSLAGQKERVAAQRQEIAERAKTKTTYPERAAVYIAAIERWGMDAQMWMVVEEMSELMKEICKARRGKDNKEDIADEIADVTIMLEQLRLMVDADEAVCEHIDYKIARLRQRLGMPVE